VPSSGSFLCPYELLEGRTGYVVITHETTTTSAHRQPTLTVYDKQHNQFCLQVTHKDIGRSLKMAHG
jgi:hypothetical protein